MPRVWIPPLLRDLTHGADVVAVAGDSVRQAVAALEQLYPGVQARLCDGDDLRPGLVVVVGTAVSSSGLRHRLDADSEVHFLPAIGGGA